MIVISLKPFDFSSVMLSSCSDFTYFISFCSNYTSKYILKFQELKSSEFNWHFQCFLGPYFISFFPDLCYFLYSISFGLNFSSRISASFSFMNFNILMVYYFLILLSSIYMFLQQIKLFNNYCCCYYYYFFIWK